MKAIRKSASLREIPTERRSGIAKWREMAAHLSRTARPGGQPGRRRKLQTADMMGTKWNGRVALVTRSGRALHFPLPIENLHAHQYEYFPAEKMNLCYVLSFSLLCTKYDCDRWAEAGAGTGAPPILPLSDASVRMAPILNN